MNPRKQSIKDYPDAFPGNLPEGLPDKEDASQALEKTEEILQFVSRRI